MDKKNTAHTDLKGDGLHKYNFMNILLCRITVANVYLSQTSIVCRNITTAYWNQRWYDNMPLI